MEGNSGFAEGAIGEPNAAIRGFAEQGDIRLLYRWRAPLLGELAVEDGLIDPEGLAGLLSLHQKSGARLGDILVSTGHAHPNDIARLIGRQRRIRCVDLEFEPADPDLAHEEDLNFYIAHRCMPWRRMVGETIYVAADPDKAARVIAERLGRPHPVFVASAHVIDEALRSRFRHELDARARLHLLTRYPESSASRRLTTVQSVILATSAALGLALLLVAPAATLLSLNIILGIFFIAVAALRGVSIFVGLFASPTAEELAHERSANDFADADLPVYSVLVPLFREAKVLPLLADALMKLDYPSSKLDIKFIFEDMDRETYEAAKALQLPHNFEFIRVPASLPLTKPKACNYALPFAHGEYIVVYDAEDLPEPDQLRRAVAAFRLGDENLACVQAQLNYYNWFENWLTRQFALEYASFFDLLLPTLAKFGMPIPLGGTSTHFRANLLRQAGAWDPYNVTEDADLGMRFGLLGFRTGIIRSTTHEEAVCHLGNWIRQRSRWIKGWTQTYLVRMRHPVRLYRALGFKGFAGFQLVIGGLSLSSLIHPFFYLSILAAFVASSTLASPQTSFAIAMFDLVVLIAGYGITILAGMTAVTIRGLRPLVLHALMMPAYWMLISVSAYRAMFQFVVKPFHWEKTRHGISRLTSGRLKRVKQSVSASEPSILP